MRGRVAQQFWSAAGEILWISDDADYWAVFLFDANIVNGSWSEPSKQREEEACASFYSSASHGWIIIGFSCKCTKRNWLQNVGEYAVDHFKTYLILFLKIRDFCIRTKLFILWMTPKLWQTAAGKTQRRGIKHWRMHKFVRLVAPIPVVILIPVLELLSVVACKWGNVVMLYAQMLPKEGSSHPEYPP